MKRKLIIDGNAVYEIDEDCMLKKRMDKEQSRNTNRTGHSQNKNKKD